MSIEKLRGLLSTKVTRREFLGKVVKTTAVASVAATSVAAESLIKGKNALADGGGEVVEDVPTPTATRIPEDEQAVGNVAEGPQEEVVTEVGQNPEGQPDGGTTSEVGSSEAAGISPEGNNGSGDSSSAESEPVPTATPSPSPTATPTSKPEVTINFPPTPPNAPIKGPNDEEGKNRILEVTRYDYRELENDGLRYYHARGKLIDYSIEGNKVVMHFCYERENPSNIVTFTFDFKRHPGTVNFITTRRTGMTSLYKTPNAQITMQALDHYVGTNSPAELMGVIDRSQSKVKNWTGAVYFWT